MDLSRRKFLEGFLSAIASSATLSVNTISKANLPVAELSTNAKLYFVKGLRHINQVRFCEAEFLGILSETYARDLAGLNDLESNIKSRFTRIDELKKELEKNRQLIIEAFTHPASTEYYEVYCASLPDDVKIPKLDELKKEMLELIDRPSIFYQEKCDKELEKIRKNNPTHKKPIYYDMAAARKAIYPISCNSDFSLTKVKEYFSSEKYTSLIADMRSSCESRQLG